MNNSELKIQQEVIQVMFNSIGKADGEFAQYCVEILYNLFLLSPEDFFIVVENNRSKFKLWITVLDGYFVAWDERQFDVLNWEKNRGIEILENMQLDNQNINMSNKELLEILRKIDVRLTD